MNNAADEIGEAISGEMRLIDPEVRTSRRLAEELLHPDFVEVGSSGRRWDREAVLAELPELPGSDGDDRYEVSGMSGVRLAPGLVHLTYETVIGGRRARRSSLWRRDTDGPGWRMYYHQATPVPSSTGDPSSPR